MLSPHHICAFIGHRPKFEEGGYYFRAGRRRTRFHQRCTRCGTSDSGTIYTQGHLEPFRWNNLRYRAIRICRSIATWFHARCEDCHQTNQRCGHPIGDHSGCDEIPF